MQYKKINNLLGWLCFAIASVTYILTLEPSVSFWDCGEFISCAYRLQVAHQPGYPLFAMLGKMFSLLSLGDNTKVPYFTNMGSAIASGATIMFLFWTITAIAKKMLANKPGEAQDDSKTILIMGAGLVGALAFTFTDTFWFSAVETIVFALSSLCTAIVFWAILKWDAHADEAGADKWIIFIAYIIGLSIGIHLLNLLTIPAIAMVYYFRRSKNINVTGAVGTFFIGVLILVLVQYGIRGYTIQIAAYFDLFFVNSLGTGFWSGAFVFFFLIVAAIVGGIYYSIKYKKPLLNLALLCIAFVYFGYSSFAYIPIRATANPDLNNSHPDNAFTLYGYLNRIQYGENPLLFGQYFDAKVIDQTEGNTLYRKGKTSYENAGKKTNYVYDHTTFLPRMYSSEGQDPQFYHQWLQIPDGQAPTFTDNMKWMFSWQIYQMYVRYFLWNYVGRYNDADGQQSTAALDGNWTSGILDGGKHLPKSVVGGGTPIPGQGLQLGYAYTPLYALPFIIGLLGAIYHFQRKKRDALVVLLLFFFTGLAIVFYVNQPSIQPRERDYSYVGSFYAFAIWIGLGVIAIAELIRFKLNAKTAGILATVICLFLAPVLMASKEWKSHDRSTKMTPHDMAYNYLISCPPNAILFTYGDNDTYSLWYDQEVEGIRPDVRIVNLSLFTGDWYIRQMQGKMNASEPLPITMPYDKYKEGVRDVIYFDDKKIPGSVEVKDVFDFISSDDKSTQVQYQSGESGNYLPTKNFKITINADDVLKNHVITPEQKDKLATVMEWKYTSNYITKENLAMLDILAHNNWKRPICFTTTIGNENLIGLQPYLYKEGFAYHLIPFKPDTSTHDQLGKTNSLVMYNNMMNKFKYGNFKTAKYLDHESTTMFYPVMITTFLDLTQGLIKDGHPDLALKALHKYDEVMPDINPGLEVADRKIFMGQTAYTLNDPTLGDKLLSSVDNYIVDQLDYNYSILQGKSGELSYRDIQYGVSFINGMLSITNESHRTALSKKLSDQLKDYESKFGSVLQRQQQ
ncbi:protein O-mannosyl-transferase family [Mucilaginibacter sp.]|uniref:protein O-mannosyl-transferase family n=1 Tax=Mucilaginibacter sp. TaxID=1882438 RepID=UPI003D0F4BC8